MKAKMIVVFLTLFVLSNCKKPIDNKEDSFTFMGRGDYVIDSYGDKAIYRDKETGTVMDGYYVVGNEVSKWEEFNLKNGVLNGDYLIFHSNGEIYTHSNYLNGKLHGDEKVYYISGKLHKSKNYKHDEPYGKTIDYFESGQVQTESTIKNGNVVESVSYDIVGTIVAQMYQKEGRTIHQRIVGGKIYSEQISSNYDNFEAMKYYNEDGSMKFYLRILTDGDIGYLVELDADENEIKRIDIKANPQEAMKYMEYLTRM